MSNEVIEIKPTKQLSVIFNKSLLAEFLTCPMEEITQDQIKEVNKLISLILFKYCKTTTHLHEDMRSLCMLAMLERRVRFVQAETDSATALKAYNYLYSMARNCAQNYGIKVSKLTYVEDVTEVNEPVYEDRKLNIPPAVTKYISFLTGEEDFETVKIPKQDVTDLLLFLRLKSTKLPELPEYFTEVRNVDQGLYSLVKLLMDMISE